MPVTHAFVSGKADGGDATLVRPSNWDAAHVGARDLLTDDRTYYVRTDGNDSNTGLVDTAGGAWLTIQHAIDVVSLFDYGGYTVTIKIGNGTYNEEVSIPSHLGDGTLVLEGDSTTPSNVVISNNTTDAICVYAGGSVYAELYGVKLISSGTNGRGLVAEGIATTVYFESVEFGVCSGFHIWPYSGGSIICYGDYIISGDAAYHIIADNGTFIHYGDAVTISGSRAFNTFARADTGGKIIAAGCTYTGTVTGKRFESNLNSIIQTWDSGINYFPGDIAGTLTTGGVYDTTETAYPKLLDIYPVGAIYMSTVSTSPATLFGGTWSALAAGRVLIGDDAGTFAAGNTGGASTANLAHTHSLAHTHTTGQASAGATSRGATSSTLTLGTHTHTTSAQDTTNTTSNGATNTNIMNPYLAVYMWQRTA